MARRPRASVSPVVQVTFVEVPAASGPGTLTATHADGESTSWPADVAAAARVAELNGLTQLDEHGPVRVWTAAPRDAGPL